MTFILRPVTVSSVPYLEEDTGKEKKKKKKKTCQLQGVHDKLLEKLRRRRATR